MFYYSRNSFHSKLILENLLNRESEREDDFPNQLYFSLITEILNVVDEIRCEGAVACRFLVVDIVVRPRMCRPRGGYARPRRRDTGSMRSPGRSALSLYPLSSFTFYRQLSSEILISKGVEEGKAARWHGRRRRMHTSFLVSTRGCFRRKPTTRTHQLTRQILKVWQ